MEAFNDVFVDSLRVSIDKKREADRFRPLEYDSQSFKQLNSVPDGDFSCQTACSLWCTKQFKLLHSIYWEGFLHRAK